MSASREACSGWGRVELSFLGATFHVSTHAPSTCTDIPTSAGGPRAATARPGADSRAAPAGCGTSLREVRLEPETRNSRGRTARLAPIPASLGCGGPRGLPAGPEPPAPAPGVESDAQLRRAWGADGASTPALRPPTGHHHCVRMEEPARPSAANPRRRPVDELTSWARPHSVSPSPSGSSSELASSVSPSSTALVGSSARFRLAAKGACAGQRRGRPHHSACQGCRRVRGDQHDRDARARKAVNGEGQAHG